MAVRTLDLPDWAIGAGFVRAPVWDHLSKKTSRTPIDDIDVLFFDPADLSKEREKHLEKKLRKARPDIPWSVKNQARMHFRNNNHAYENTEDAMRYWLETPTAVAVRLEADNRLTVLAPFGLDDLFQMILRPTPEGARKMDQFEDRIKNKPWLEHWPDLRIEKAPAVSR
ncbi:MAG: nucleotidyltransferase family protein [Sneathiellales bacterium]|nr:nucleotidyltransferase family protein [Sneathiellales bacterium]